MHKRLAVLILLGLICPGLLGAQSAFENRLRITPGLGFEYFHRSLDAGEEGEKTPTLQSLFFTVGAEFSLNEKVAFEAFAGYSLTGLDQMVFRQLPFSIELETGRIGGFIFGGNLEVVLAEFSDFEISGRGRIVFSIGMDKEWALSGLAVDGSASGSPNWLQVTLGPVVSYTAFDDFLPYVFLGYEHFSGSFTLQESIQTLTGSEERGLNGLGKLQVAIGSLYWLTDRLRLNGELSLIPNSKGVDWGIALSTRYDF